MAQEQQPSLGVRRLEEQLDMPGISRQQQSVFILEAAREVAHGYPVGGSDLERLGYYEFPRKNGELFGFGATWSFPTN